MKFTFLVSKRKKRRKANINFPGGLYEQLHGDIESDVVFYLTDFNWVPLPTKLLGGYRHGAQLIKSGSGVTFVISQLIVYPLVNTPH